MRLRRIAALAATALLAPLVLTACDSAAATEGDGRVQVLASFYPLQFVSEQVGGDLVDVENLTPPAADPHDLELSLARARELGLADVVVYLSGFQPAVDDAIAQRRPANLVDAADHVTLLSASVTGGDQAHDHGTDVGGEYDSHSHDTHGHGDPAGDDPHFWLDPTLLARLAQPVADALAAADPANAETFNANAADLEDRLQALDQELADGLAPFAGATLITNHTAFGYLAQRYGLEQVGITGLDHNTEPSPARLREIGQIARDHHVATLFYETLVSPRVVQTLASDQGLRAAVLDTLEGLTQDKIDAGEDYVTVMQRNLRTLQEGLVAQ
ncbi:metal ABC transporter solute-binding protein, Zn/Mn family [Xylanimonas sp. McL0601]|uniref:metal ABC transporter solute-binding protein, Zn/Mn family n=1 Tax=Xylanimonas sp. McL0601 TaxID=3414739 RepID=UPI003CF55A19